MITRSDLRARRVGPVMYRWFLRAFPAGGSYADVHRALQREGYTDWANSTVEYGWSKWREEASFAQQDIDAMGNISCEQAAGKPAVRWRVRKIMPGLAVRVTTLKLPAPGMLRRSPVPVTAHGLAV